jgi:hypothetical protein
MHLRGFVLLPLLLSLATPALAQAARDLEADRLAEKLWRIIDITKQYQPQFQAHVTLEAPDGERLAFTFDGASARTLVHDDVITLERQPDVSAESPAHDMGASFLPRLTPWGKPRWWGERVQHEGHELRKAWKLFFLPYRGRETAL